MKDLIIVVADGYQEKLLEGLLPRVSRSNNISEFTYDIYKHPEHDSGCFNNSHEFLRPFLNQYKYALVLFDKEGCGKEFELSRVEIENNVEGILSSNGWNLRNSVIVIDPEVENWVWIDSPHVHSAIDWIKHETLFEWCRNNNYISQKSTKPNRPKEIFELALRISGTSKSSSIYKKIASRVSFRLCSDPAFIKLISTLNNWFSL